MAEELDSGDDWIPAYTLADIEQEPRPNHIIYRSSYANLSAGINNIGDVLLGPLQTTPLKLPVVEKLKQEIDRQTKQALSGEIEIIVTGAMGSGKSSVINSLLGVGIIARISSEGGSCTWVVQRFTKMFPGQDAPFAARVYFFSSDEIRNILKTNLARFYRATHRINSMTEDDDDLEASTEDYNDQNTVLEALMPLFAEREEFADRETAMDFLARAQSEDDNTLLETLMQWTEEILESYRDGKEFVYVSAVTPHKLLLDLQRFTYAVEERDTQPMSQMWMLVKNVDFGLDTPITNAGIVLTDVPGRSDANFIRANNAKMFDLRCHFKIIVENIIRAKDDKALRQALADAVKFRGPGNTLLVLTRGHEIDSITSVTGSPLEKAREQMLKDECEALRQERMSMGKRTPRSTAERMDLTLQMQQKDLDHRLKCREWTGYRLPMRNASVKAKIQTQYKEITHDPRPFPVYVVANNFYEAYQDGCSSLDKPALTLEQVGILDLRGGIHTLPCDGKLGGTLHIAQYNIPDLLETVDLYCSKTHIARREDLEEIILQQKGKLHGLRRDTYNRFRDSLATRVLEPLVKREMTWNTKARRLYEGWGFSYEKEFLSLMKNNGNKGTRKRGEEICFDEELVQILKRPMEECFVQLQKALADRIKGMFFGFRTILMDARKQIGGNLQTNLMTIQPLLASFTHLERKSKVAVYSALMKLNEAINDIVDAALLSPDTGYVAKAMMPVYAEVSKIKGRGAPKKRPIAFQKLVCQIGGVWMDVHSRIDKAFDKLFDDHLKSLAGEFEKMLDHVHKRLVAMCDHTAAKTDEEKAEEEVLITNLAEASSKAREQLQGPLQKLVAECKPHSKIKDEETLFVEKD